MDLHVFLFCNVLQSYAGTSTLSKVAIDNKGAKYNITENKVVEKYCVVVP
jgi:hypothetical protein